MMYSIVIAMFNSQSTISKVLESVRAQSFTNWELIIVNDGSTDESPLLVREFIIDNPNLIIKLLNTENGGVSKARNLGIKIAIGDYIALLDADDIWHSKKLEIFIPYLREDYAFFGHLSTLYEFAEIDPLIDDDLNSISYFKLLIKNRFVTPSVIFKNENVAFFDEQMSYTEDHDLWLRLSFKKNALLIRKELVKLNRAVLSEGGASSNKWLMRKGEIKMYIKSASYSKLSAILLPFLIMFSLGKFLKKIIIR